MIHVFSWYTSIKEIMVSHQKQVDVPLLEL